jgi:transcriptional regulator GlxA family with amidase domain
VATRIDGRDGGRVPSRLVVIVAFPDVDLLDVAGPGELFFMATQAVAGARPAYRLLVAAPGPGLEVRTMGGVSLRVDSTLDTISEPIDTLIVPGAVRCGPAGAEPVVDTAVVDWLTRVRPYVRRVASVCAGAHALAAAGYLDGLPATTHWATAERLGRDHPGVQVVADRGYVHTGQVWTGSGGTSAMDLALALVAEDHGDEVASTVARWLVMDVKRSYGSVQLDDLVRQSAGERPAVDALCAWIAAHLTENLSAPVLAERMHLSQRQFTRVFRRETGVSPAAYVEAVRVRAARQLLEGSDYPLSTVAERCGLGSVETLHRAFRRHQEVTPAEYRRRLRAAQPATGSTWSLSPRAPVAPIGV